MSTQPKSVAVTIQRGAPGVEGHTETFDAVSYTHLTLPTILLV